eukprot:6172505-Pleurochrysis_carterae.AAC.2
MCIIVTVAEADERESRWKFVYLGAQATSATWRAPPPAARGSRQRVRAPMVALPYRISSLGMVLRPSCEFYVGFNQRAAFRRR